LIIFLSVAVSNSTPLGLTVMAAIKFYRWRYTIRRFDL